MIKRNSNRLQTEEMTPFMSFRSLSDAHRELMQERRDAAETAVFWQNVTTFIQRAEAAGAYLDRDEDRQTAQTYLDYWANHLFRAGQEAPPAILAPFDVHTQPELPDDLCPYVGLDAFQETDSHLFFGRSALVKQMLAQCQASRLIAVVGSSGVGKSSAVFAGLLPQLREYGRLPTEPRTLYPLLVPGSTPLTHLARLLQPAGVNDADWMIEHVVKFQENSDHLLNLVNEQGGETAVFIIDQFEELFTLCHDAAERQAFIENIFRLVNSRSQQHSVIFTLRTDYESYLVKYPLFQTLMSQSEVRVGPMSAAELREAIEKPADLVGLKFEEGLVDTLIREIVGEPAALPLLQFTLLQLWEGRERNRVTWEAYHRLGGVLQALARTADGVYNSLLPEDQIAARRILLRLVRPSEGLEVTRNRVRRSAIYQSGEAPDRIDRVLNRLIQARLVHLTKGVNPTDDQVEVAHEALVRNWPRLVGWLDEERIRLRYRQRLTDQAEQWNRFGRDPGALLRGALLREALEYKDLNELETQFVQASQEAMFLEQREKEQKHKHELAQARKLAEEQEQRAKAQAIAAQRLGYAAVAMAIALVAVLSGIAIFLVSRTETSEIMAVSTQQALTNELFLREQGATATAQATISLGQFVAEATQEAFATATAVSATVESQRATAEFEATRAARLSPTPPNNHIPAPQEILEQQLALDAQLKVAIRQADNMPMRYITGSTFTMGADSNAPNAQADAQPPHTVTLNSFYMDQYEVTVQQYASFINTLGGYKEHCSGYLCVLTQFETQYTYLLNNLGFYEPVVGFDNYPINWITWYGARDYCEWVGGRLPTEAEWEYAARGINGRYYPWGNTQPTPSLATFGQPATQRAFRTAFQPVDALPEGTSPFGLYNMSGSVAEWVLDGYDPTYYTTNPGAAPNLNRSSEHVLRGGSWVSTANDLYTYSRDHLDPHISLESRNALTYWGVGFRCVVDLN